MGKTLKTTCKMCRREGVSLCGKEKCALKRRPTPPGVHGPAQGIRKPRLSSYAIQLREKQKAKRLYNIMERQFRRYFEAASLKRGNTADFLVQTLERRLDNVVYRLGFAKTRRQARQMVGHGFITVNGKLVDIPSYTVRVGEAIAFKDSKKNKGLLSGLSERLQKTEAPRWLSLDSAAMTGKVTSLPEGEDLKSVFDPTLIVEFYSR
jgi:small subunit ribosomal protein S4